MKDPGPWFEKEGAVVRDTFLHRTFMAEEIQVGATVSYTIELREDGSPQARDVKQQTRKAAAATGGGNPKRRKMNDQP